MYKTRIEKHRHRVWLLNRKIKKMSLNRRFKQRILLPTRKYLTPTLWSILLTKLRLAKKKKRTKATRQYKSSFTAWFSPYKVTTRVDFSVRKPRVFKCAVNNTALFWC